MKFLINCSNLKVSGGLQVGDSICGQLARFPQHRFVVVLSSAMVKTSERIKNYNNVTQYIYDIRNTWRNILFGRDYFLDKIVEDEAIDAVLTVFGPSRWTPRAPHLCGFARAQLIKSDSPYFKTISTKDRILFVLWKISFKKNSDYLYTENNYITQKLPELLGDKKVYTVTNYYNQIFDQPSLWRRNIKIPAFSGTTCLSVSSHMVHKNFEIIPSILGVVKNKYPELKLRFVVTFDSDEMEVPQEYRDNILFTGKVDISDVPNLYEQSDIMFMPTLIECFTSTYPEAMRMGKPIVTTDLEFARGLCGEAASYYSALDAEAAADAIYKVAKDKEYAAKLVDNGKLQLQIFDNYEQRTDKLVKILEDISN